MNKKNVIFLVVAILCLCIAIGFVFWVYSDKKENNDTTYLSNQNVDPMDAFESQLPEVKDEESQTKDLEATYTNFTIFNKDQKEVKLSDFENMAIMVLFWNSDNADSVEMLERVNAQYQKYKSQIQFLAINTNESNLDSLNQQYALEVTMPVYYDLNHEAINNYKIEEVPAMIYINKENQIVNSKTGLTTEDALEANLDILAENF